MSKTIANEEYQIKKAYVFSNYNVSHKGVITYLPIYMVSFINNHNEIGLLDPIE